MSTAPDLVEDTKDPSPYIRTFAKDFAALSGQTPEIATRAKSKTPPAPKKTSESLVTRAPAKSGPADLSELEKEAESIDERTREEVLSIPTNEEAETVEPISLPKIVPGDIVTETQEQLAAIPEPPAVGIPQVVRAPAPTPLPPAPVDMSASPEREGILARLRARVGSHKQEATHSDTPVPSAIHSSVMMPRHETPLEIPIAAPAPVHIPVPVPPPAPKPTPIPVPPPQLKIEESSPLHTYKSDFSDHVDEQRASTFSVLAAQNDAPRKPVARKTDFKKPIEIAIGVILLIAGVSGIFAAYVYMSKSAPVLGISVPPSLITPDSSVLLSGKGTVLMQALADKSNTASLPSNYVLLTYVNESTTTPQGVVEEPASGGAFLSELNLSAPDILLRNIDPSSMVGIVQAGNQTRPFFILRVTSYERTFAGMLQWEPTMFDNLSILYPLYPPTTTSSVVPVTTATSSKSASAATTRVSTENPYSNIPATQFVDEVVANHSARALKDSTGRTIVLYGYADKQTLVIARDEAAFTLLLSRLATSGN